MDVLVPRVLNLCPSSTTTAKTAVIPFLGTKTRSVLYQGNSAKYFLGKCPIVSSLESEMLSLIVLAQLHCWKCTDSCTFIVSVVSMCCGNSSLHKGFAFVVKSYRPHPHGPLGRIVFALFGIQVSSVHHVKNDTRKRRAMRSDRCD